MTQPPRRDEKVVEGHAIVLLRVVDVGQEDTQRTFTFPTTVGLHDEFGNLLAVAKMSRPVEKNDEKDITFRVRLDF